MIDLLRNLHNPYLFNISLSGEEAEERERARDPSLEVVVGRETPGGTEVEDALPQRSCLP